VLGARRQDRIKALADELTWAGGQALDVTTDVTAAPCQCFSPGAAVRVFGRDRAQVKRFVDDCRLRSRAARGRARRANPARRRRLVCTGTSPLRRLAALITGPALTVSHHHAAATPAGWWVVLIGQRASQRWRLIAHGGRQRLNAHPAWVEPVPSLPVAQAAAAHSRHRPFAGSME
jgi:hypothetical protein